MNLEKQNKAPIFFAYALCPWERGTVENTIGLLRQFIPKGTDLNLISESLIRELQKAINSRPRKSLNFKAPLEIITGKKQRLIKQQRIEPMPPEYYEQFHLTPEEIEEMKKFRKKIVALTSLIQEGPVFFLAAGTSFSFTSTKPLSFHLSISLRIFHIKKMFLNS